MALRDVEVTIEGRAFKLKALLDSGSSFTIMGVRQVEGGFGRVKAKPLVRPREAALLSGQKIVIDGYIDAQIVIDGYLIEDRVYLTKDMVKEAALEGERGAIPDLIIGAPTLETWGLKLSLKEGRVVRRGSLII